MRFKLSEQLPCGILDSLIARLLLENNLEGVATLLDALRYLQSGTIASLLAIAPVELMGVLSGVTAQES
ncbi:MAG TPA: hypothetical protein VEI49_05645 [Terriglobales bacterium]|nr:hypothetical protein [Terriglobales bacterium]